MIRYKLASSAIVLAIVTMSATPALAQEATNESPPETGLDEIVVTARRVSENLQSVPVAITAFSGEDLKAQGARSALDIQTLTPNLKIREAGGNPSALSLAIRGQVQTDIISTLDPSIGVYVDEVYYARAIGLSAGLLDIERVEVLKGPQGTLFGRNTTGGALNISTAKPDATEFSGHIRANVGNYSRFDTEAVVNVPLVPDKLALRVAGQRQKSSGYGRDLVSGERLAETNNYTIRGKLRWTPNDRLDVTISAEHFNLDQNGPVQRLLYVSPTTVIPLGGGVALTIPATPEIVTALATGGCFDTALLAGLAPTFPCAGFSTYTPGPRTFASYIGGNPYDVSLTQVPKVTAKTTTASLNAQYDLGDATLKYIGAYRKIENASPIDLDGTPITILQTTTAQKSHSWSHELQLSGKAFDNVFDYTLGVYRFNESGSDGSTTLALPVINPFNPSATRGFVASKALAFYGQGTAHLSDAFSLTAGLRWSQDKKRLDSRSTVAGVCVVPVALLNNPNAPCSAIFNRTDEAISYTASANYKVAENVLVYAKTSRGFRGGGFNLRGTSVLSFTPFDPEKVTDYELGLKSEFFDRRARFNVALFTSDYSDIQKSTIVANGQGGTATIVANAASARVKGFEAELTVLPVDGLRLSGTIGLTDAKYKSFPAVCVVPGGPAAGTPCDRSGEPFEQVPKATWSLSGEYRVPVASGEAAFRLDYSHVSSIVSQGITYTQTPDLASFVTQKGYGLLNGRLSWAMGDKGFEIAAWVRNLTDTRYYVGHLDFVNSGLGYIEGQPAEPRTFGVEVGYKF
ncbi:MAG: TonB-dependent receptor [Sphingorhabdus sp.]